MESGKTHHFLYYIFQFDKKRCIMEEKRARSLHRHFQKTLKLFQKGEKSWKKND